VTHLSRKICVHAQTKDLWWKSLYTGKSPNKIKSYVILHHIISMVASVLRKSLLPQILRKISAMKNLSQYIIHNVKDINTVVDSAMCGYFNCSGVHGLHMRVAQKLMPHIFFSETIYSQCMKYTRSITGCFLYTCYFST
jgi:uncharacterized membrane protein